MRIPVEKTADNVRAMFDQIAPRYDFLNHTLSLGIDIRWRNTTVKAAKRKTSTSAPEILDLCCGTGDLTFALRDGFPGASRVIGSDFSANMIDLAEQKRGERSVSFEVGDATAMRFDDGSFDVVSVAFGIRNVVDLDRGLAEMRRLLRPGGIALILEFSTPPIPLMNQVYRLYFHRILPTIGNRISKSSDSAYTYLPESVDDFPGPKELADRMTAAGFDEVTWKRLTFGIACLHIGKVA
jgi:demethylmenaquinone methyltransferase/2-methoxy-6-polyprenyl-1,4-benzoquinol methylase